MGIQKNVASQKIGIFAFDELTGAGKTGDAANISAEISKDYGASAATDDAAPTELDATDHPGIYVFDLLQAETNADAVVITAVSSTSNIVIDPVQVFTVPENFNALDIESTGEVGLDFNNIKDATGAHTLTNITVPNVTTTANNSDKTGYTLTNFSDANAGKLEDMLDGTGAVLTLSQLRVDSTSADAGIYVTNSVGHGIQITATAVGKHGLWAAGLGSGASYGIYGHSITGNGIYAYSSGTGHAFSAYADGTGDAFKLASDGGNIAVELKAIADTALTDYDPPTNTEFEARTLATADYFDPANDAVANVTLTATCTTLTGHTVQTGDSYAITNSGTFGNSALKTLIDTVDGIADAILVDTGTTVPAQIAAMIGADSDTLETLSDQLDNIPTTGSGSVSWTINVKVGGVAVDGAEVKITSDAAGSTAVAGPKYTDASGDVDFLLDAGTYYVWVQRSGLNFTNPTTITVTA